MKPPRKLLRISAGVLVAGLLSGGVIYWQRPEWLLDAYRVWQRRGAGLERGSAEVGRWTVPYLDSAGEGDRPVIVLLHGFGDTKDNLIELAAKLTEDYRVVIPDLPGFGETAIRPQADYTAELYVTTVLGLLDQLEISAAHLAGYSMGGLLAVKIADRAPSRIQSLILLAPAGIRGDQPSKVEQMIREGQENPLIYRDRESFERMLRLNFNRMPDIPDFAIRALLAQGKRRAEIYETVFQCVLDDVGTTAFEQQVASLSMPVLVIGGDDDQIVDQSAIARWQEIHPGIDVVMLGQASHGLVHQRSEEVREKIRRHLDKTTVR